MVVFIIYMDMNIPSSGGFEKKEHFDAHLIHYSISKYIVSDSKDPSQ